MYRTMAYRRHSDAAGLLDSPAPPPDGVSGNSKSLCTAKHVKSCKSALVSRGCSRGSNM